MLLSALKHYFGFDQLRLGQAQVIDAIMQGHSAAAIFPTGSGKSLCYQLPATQLPHLTLVISPLLALMKDQLDFLQRHGIAAAAIDSSQTFEQSQQVMQGVRHGQIKILMISVERLKNERFMRFIEQVPISLMVIDEAHCISEWGHNFRPDYLKLAQYQQQLSIPQVLLLTATATEPVIRDIQSKFAINSEHIVVTGFYRGNLDLTVEATDPAQRMARLQQHLATAVTLPTIVYVTLQHTAEEVAKQLAQRGIAAQAYHAGMESVARQKIQADFMAGKYACIVATIAFGMGIDKADIRRVIHYDLPKSIENYSQEIGRAGRDGLPSQCTVLANKSSLTLLENFVYGDTPDRMAIAAVLEDINQAPAEWEVVLTRLSNQTNIRQLPLKTLLVYLEMRGIIRPAYSYFAEYKFKYLSDTSTILQAFHGERRDFLQLVLSTATHAKIWCTPDLETMWQVHGQARTRVIAALDYLHEKGMIQLESKLMTEVYRVLQAPSLQSGLATDLYQLFINKEQAEINRIAQLIGFFESDVCLSHRLAGYFADHQAPEFCGHCSVCRGQVAQLPSASLVNMASPEQLQAWLQPFQQKFTASMGHTASAAAQARFLCGITTPVLTKIKGRQLAGFALCEQLPFNQVRAQIEAIG